jgi:hypothetical protein
VFEGVSEKEREGERIMEKERERDAIGATSSR